MYQVSLFNDGVETLIHYPTANEDAPHILSMPFHESLSKAEQLTISIPVQNPGYNAVQGLKTKVKVIDLRDDSVVFSGRVLPTKESMSSEGKFIKEITCEGAMNYLNDSKTRRWDFINQTPAQIFQYLLDRHNEKMDNERKLCLGNIEITLAITISTNYETTLNTIISKVRNIIGGDLRVQERDGKLYLDYLIAQGQNNNVEVSMGYNLKDMLVEYDPTDIISRGIPLGYGEGINQLDITSVNNGVEYLEDSVAVSKYGIIEDTITNKDIQDANTLKLYGQTVLDERKQPRFTYTISSLDLSLLVGHENEKYELGDTLHTIAELMNIDAYSRVIERDRDLITSPWNPTLTISTRPITLTDQIVDLKQRNLTLENAPQGNTYIDTFGYAENIDRYHNFQLPIWISPDVINVNRVILHIDAQPYRAYEKSVTGGASSKKTSDGGGNKTFSKTVTRWGDPRSVDDTMAAPNEMFPIGAQPGYASETGRYFYDYEANGMDISYAAAKYVYSYGMSDTPLVDLYLLQHVHETTLPMHDHGMDHSHDNTLDYGIYESTYPCEVSVWVDGELAGGVYGSRDTSGAALPFSIDVDITHHVNQPGRTYKLEISSGQNGRVNCWVSMQAFIQSK